MVAAIIKAILAALTGLANALLPLFKEDKVPKTLIKPQSLCMYA